MKTEIDLIKAAQAGNQKAFALLFERYKSVLTQSFAIKLRGTGLENELEDILLEGFSRSFTKINTFDPKFTFGAWLGKICSNHMIDVIRKRKLNTISLEQQSGNDEEDSFQIDLPSLDNNPLQGLLQDQVADIAKNAIQQLPELIRDLMVMRYIDELSYEEIAEEMDMPIGTVKNRLFRGRSKMEEILKENNIDREIYCE